MKIETGKIKKNFGWLKSLGRIPGAAASHPFSASLFLFFIALALGFLIFYKYVFLSQRAAFSIPEKQSFFNEAAYEEVLKRWQDQENKFKEAETKEYPDPFRRSVPLNPVETPNFSPPGE